MKVIDDQNNYIVNIPDNLIITSGDILDIFNRLYRIIYVTSDTTYVKSLTEVTIGNIGWLKECKLWT